MLEEGEEDEEEEEDKEEPDMAAMAVAEARTPFGAAPPKSPPLSTGVGLGRSTCPLRAPSSPPIVGSAVEVTVIFWAQDSNIQSLSPLQYSF